MYTFFVLQLLLATVYGADHAINWFEPSQPNSEGGWSWNVNMAATTINQKNNQNIPQEGKTLNVAPGDNLIFTFPHSAALNINVQQFGRYGGEQDFNDCNFAGASVAATVSPYTLSVGANPGTLYFSSKHLDSMNPGEGNAKPCMLGMKLKVVIVPPNCNVVDGSTANAAACNCGTLDCTNDNGLFCTLGVLGSGDTCAPAPPCTQTDGSTTNAAECQCGTSTCTTSNGLFCFKASNGMGGCNTVVHSMAYSKIDSGSCTAAGAISITDQTMCSSAAARLNLQDTTASVLQNPMDKSGHPKGCVFNEAAPPFVLSLNPNADSTVSCGNNINCICATTVDCTNSAGNTPNSAACKCGGAICGSGAVCTASSSLCAAPTCGNTDGSTANAADCQCGTSTCTSSNGLFCTASGNDCALVAPCTQTDGSTANAASCKCGTSTCTSSNGLFCTASSSTCAAGAPCTETDGLTTNAAPGCRCGTASCSQNNLFCTASENTCAVGPPCSKATGVHPNSAPCKCGKTSCTISGGLYCDATVLHHMTQKPGECRSPSFGVVGALAEIAVLKAALETKVTTLETDLAAEKATVAAQKVKLAALEKHFKGNVTQIMADVTTNEKSITANDAGITANDADIVVINTKLTSVDTLYNNINKVCKTSETSDDSNGGYGGRRTDEGIGCGGSTEELNDELNAAHTTTIGLTSIVLAVAMVGVNFL